MAKTKTQFVCQQCGRTSPRQMGRCPQCGAWNSMIEQFVVEPKQADVRPRSGVPSVPRRLSEVEDAADERLPLPIEEFSRVLGGGIVPGSVVLVGGDPGIGKCVTAETRVLDPSTGDFLPILAWQLGGRSAVGMHEATLRLRPSPVSAFHSQGQRAVVRVTTRLGRQLRCTPSHPVHTPEGWRPVGELGRGDRIAAPRSLPFFGCESMPEPEIRLIAHTLSEGSSVQSAIGVTSGLPQVAADLEQIADAFGMRLVRYPKRDSATIQYRFVNPRGSRPEARGELARALRSARQQSGIAWAEWARRAGVSYGMLNVWRRGECTPGDRELNALAEAIGVPLSELAPAARHRAEMNTPIARFLERHGLRHARAADKSVPACIFHLPREQLALFLRTLFTGDGSVFVSRSGLCGFSYSTISRRLAEDVQHLLLRFGVIATLRTKRSKVAGRDYVAYEVSGVGARRTQAFVSAIGIEGRQAALAALAGRSPIGESSQTDTVPTGEAFWSLLREASGGMGFRELSEQAGVMIRNRRRERPLRRTTVARLAGAFPHPRLEALGTGDVYWDEIVSVEPDGQAEVFDLSIAGHANFVANDLIVHNSTLLLQVAARLAEDAPVLYVSGEESERQIKMRARRLAGDGHVPAEDNLFLVTETDLAVIQNHIEATRPRLVVIDSIQTVYRQDLASAAGSVSQVREGAAQLQALAKATGIAVFLIGHVTKEGMIAGPRVLEHIVDTVLYLEGARDQAYRLLRSVKNRFGATSEVGVFEMREQGMVEVANPSEAFLAERWVNAPGSAIAVTMEGTRPLLVEMQGLASPSAFGNPRRTPNGVDFNRLLLIIAVLTRRVGLKLSDQDVFVNVVGGLRVSEPAADLAIAAALASSLQDRPVLADVALVGEVGLSGELRTVSQLAARLKEARELGFRKVIVPKSLRRLDTSPDGLEVIQARSLREALSLALVSGDGG